MTKPKPDRPSDLRKTLFKHSLSDGRDCQISWRVDFGTMQIQLYSAFISPSLIIDCLRHMSQVDERFQLAGITKPIQISSRFNISLFIANGDKDVQFKLDVYNLNTGSEKLDRLEIELTPIPEIDG